MNKRKLGVNIVNDQNGSKKLKFDPVLMKLVQNDTKTMVQACLDGNLQLIETLLNLHFSINKTFEIDQGSFVDKQFHTTIQNIFMSALKFYENGPRLSTFGLLDLVICMKNENLIHFLISKNCDIHRKHETYCPIDFAASTKNISIFQIFFEKNCIVSTNTVEIACASGSKNIVNLILKKYAPIPCILRFGITENDFSLVQHCLDRKIDVNEIFDQKGTTSLHVACKFSHHKIIEFLLSKKADVNAVQTETSWDPFKEQKFLPIFHCIENEDLISFNLVLPLHQPEDFCTSIVQFAINKQSFKISKKIFQHLIKNDLYHDNERSINNILEKAIEKSIENKNQKFLKLLAHFATKIGYSRYGQFTIAEQDLDWIYEKNLANTVKILIHGNHESAFFFLGRCLKDGNAIVFRSLFDEDHIDKTYLEYEYFGGWVYDAIFEQGTFKIVTMLLMLEPHVVETFPQYKPKCTSAIETFRHFLTHQVFPSDWELNANIISDVLCEFLFPETYW